MEQTSKFSIQMFPDDNRIVIPDSPASVESRNKRAQVKRACENCRKTHRSCTDERPCTRCKEKGWPCIEDQIRNEPSCRSKQKKAKTSEQIQDIANPDFDIPFDMSPFNSTPLDPLNVPELSLDLINSLVSVPIIPQNNFPENLSTQLKELNQNICQLTSLLKTCKTNTSSVNQRFYNFR
jgi:hypothetical protein